MDDEWMYEQDADYNRILGQTTGLLAQRGDEHAVALLVDVQSMVLVDTDELLSTETYEDPWGDEQIHRSTVGEHCWTSRSTLSLVSQMMSASGSARP